MRNSVAGALLIALSVLVFLVGMEFYVRFAYADGSNFDIEMWRYARDLKRASALSGVGHEHVPNQRGTYMGVELVTNSFGLRDEEISKQKPPGVTRILMLGDSVTLGWGAPVDGTTSEVLERRLEADSGERRFEVVNAGVGNYNTAMEVAWFVARGWELNPDLVVLNYFINDAEETPSRQENPLERFSWGAVFLAGRFDVLSRTYFGRGDWKQYYRDLYREDAPGWRTVREKLAELSAFASAHGMRVLVANHPELHELSPYPFDDVTQKLRATALAAELPFLDLLPAVQNEAPASLWVTATDAHPNARAAELFAPHLEHAMRLLYSDVVPASSPSASPAP